MLHTGGAIYGKPREQMPTEDPDQAIVSAWLKKIQNSFNPPLSKPEFARRAGVHKNTIDRGLQPKPGYHYVTSLKTLKKISRNMGFPLPSEIDVGGGLGSHGNGRGGGFYEPGLVRYEGPVPEGEELEHADQSHWEVKDRSLELAGFVPGDVITVDRRVQPVSGDAVIVQLIDLIRGSGQTVLRRYRQPYVMTATADPSIEDSPRLVDNNTVAISGTVIKRVWARKEP